MNSALALGLFTAASVAAQVAPERPGTLQSKELRLAGISHSYNTLAEAREVTGKFRAHLGEAEASARVDPRSGRFVTLMPTTPLLPGTGVGNDLSWSDFGFKNADEADIESLAWSAFTQYLQQNQDLLGDLNLQELSPNYRMAVHDGGSLIQIYAPRVFDNIPVRGSHVSAVIGQGNLTLVGLHLWGDRGALESGARLTAEHALKAAALYLKPLQIERQWGKTELVFIPEARGDRPSDVSFGQGYGYRLAWSVKAKVARDAGTWEILVDAQTGGILANEDQNQYAEAKAGVLPVTNDGVVPDGVEQPGWPMPFLNVSTSSGSQTTDTGGNLSASGSLSSALVGPYVRMNDNCGTISLTQNDNLDFGASSGTDCVTPGFGGAGNTHSSRTGFYELNKIIEMARGQLPGNGWLQNQLTSNMNINQNCNAFWNGTVNFYRSGGGCANTGEIAGVFDHEWGHGMDANDVNGGIASPSGEGIADIYTALRLNDSCIGRNFLSNPCSGNGDPCNTCTGVRDIDYLKRQSGNPHTYTWSNANCGGSVHCVGGTYSEAVWSLWKRNLQSAPYNYDNNTAHEIVTRLTFIGAGATSTWFSGGPPNGGCASSSGYMNYLAADDDNGNLNDGTPHMQAIFDAFNDQEIACGTPTVQQSGCAGTPTVAPVVGTSSGNQQIDLSWGAVAGASSYGIYRTEGVFACDFGKVKLGETNGTSWNDSGLQNGRDYYYVVIPMGASASCFGPASACATDQPVGQPDFSLSCDPGSFTLQQGGSGSANCTLISSFGYSGTVNLSCSGNPAGIGCAFSPASVSLPANGTVSASLTLNVASSQATGTSAFDVVAGDGSLSRNAGLSVQVIPEGSNGPQDAVYDSALGAPKCALPGSECDSGSLLDGRANLGPEVNQPNTLDSCTDGTSGTYHNDESNDRIVVSTLDGADMTEGATVQVAVTVWAWSTGSSDTLDLYYTDDASNPSWTLIGSFPPGGGSARVITTQYTLPDGGMQAVRANFRYQGSASSCSTGTYDDTDDLVFAVGSAGPGNTAPTVSIGAPGDGSTSDVGDPVTFSGNANDAEDGDLSSSLGWSSSIDGSIGSGGSFTTSSLSQGSHTITASVTDSGGLSSSDAISLTVNAVTNPVTVTLTSIGAEDGWTRESNETSNVGGAANANGKGARPIRPGDGTQDRQYRSILSFDTSSIPAGATVQAATLRLRRGTVRGSDPFTNGFGACLVDVNSGGFSGSPALQAADFQAAATATAVASMTAPAANGDWSEGVLNAAGLSAINLSGKTQFRVYFEVDDNDNNSDDLMGYYSGDHSNAANHPQLVVTYLP